MYSFGPVKRKLLWTKNKVELPSSSIYVNTLASTNRSSLSELANIGDSWQGSN